MAASAVHAAHVNQPAGAEEATLRVKASRLAMLLSLAISSSTDAKEQHSSNRSRLR